MLAVVLVLGALGLGAGLFAWLRGGATVAQEPESCYRLPSSGRLVCSGELAKRHPPETRPAFDAETGCIIYPNNMLECPEVERARPQAPPTSPQPLPTLPPHPYRNNRDAVLKAPPVHRKGPAADLGRADCPAGWSALVSETTGFSLCFPPDAGLIRSGQPQPPPSTETWGHGPGGWEEFVNIVVRGGYVSVHLMGGSSAPYAPDVTFEDLPEVTLGGQAARRFENRRADGAPVVPSGPDFVQEQFGYTLRRGQVDWTVVGVVKMVCSQLCPQLTFLTPAEMQAAKELLERVAATVRIP